MNNDNRRQPDMTTTSDTIAALATGGNGAIACIRVSGAEALNIVAQIFSVNRGKNLDETAAGTMRLGKICDGNNLIDEVFAVRFQSPHSYTGEDMVEITCHASPYIIEKTLSLLIRHGCRLAQAGEFTQRAFLNGKMDLSQAEAVADLIAASSAAEHKVAISQMRGAFGKELQKIRAQLLDFVSMIELELDFAEEDVEFANRNELAALAANIEIYISKLCKSFEVGNVIKKGVPVAIAGETNVGKSTLLNILLNEERAIVSDMHGTTRDAIEDAVNIDGIVFRFIDTAGIRATDDKIENIGIERTYSKIEQAAIVLWIVDASLPVKNAANMFDEMHRRCKNKKLIIVYNKTDKVKTVETLDIIKHPNIQQIFISAKEKINLEQLQNMLIQTAQIPETSFNQTLVTNMRHFEALQNAHSAINRVQTALQQNISHDLLAQDIRECIYHIGLITGEITSNEILGNIFSRFCIGK
ncbi:MAG: tRNA uridine-5-carboxymethylaminomethyl(34) synthesis GTPase MnmE [Prevotellaceae bacterium]|jgi:tRNA modification GTPase|nr:tRNA uridine-5-carboxymethylaminomethyl(34) synthesis GTPase MnmE [Prevotellaceae bacterium]